MTSSVSPLLDAFTHDLRRRILGEVKTDSVTRTLYSTDASLYQKTALGVCFPQSAEDVQFAVQLAHHYKLPLLPRVSGTSLAGQCVNEAFVLDFSRHLDQIIELNVAERWVRVQPGVILDHLNRFLRPHGLTFGPDPASSGRAGIGGVIGNNATGAHSLLYGMSADHVRAMQVILSDGSSAELSPQSTQKLLQYHTHNSLEAQIYRQLGALTFDPTHRHTIAQHTPTHWRRSGGYNLDRLIGNDGVNFHHPQDPTFNLAKLICGSEGTLAVMTEITLDLVPCLTHTALLLLQFDQAETALSVVEELLTANPSAIEFLDSRCLRLCAESAEYRRLLQQIWAQTPHTVLIVEFSGHTSAEVAQKATTCQKQWRAIPSTLLLSDEQQRQLWAIRKAGLGLLMSQKGQRKPIPFIEDAAVPVPHLPRYIAQLEQFSADLGTEISYYAHASTGCLHVRPLLNPQITQDRHKMHQIAHFSADLVRQMGGSISSEHGDGRARSWLNEAFFGPDLYALYQRTKQIFDPHNLLNPHNIVPASPFLADLRPPLPPQSAELFFPEGGLTFAVEQCNGAGICRQRDNGAMCPTFMATRDEAQSTRGRANLLRAHLNGQLSADEVWPALSLCIGCKACKSECPSAVDMARIKMQMEHRHHQEKGISWRTKLFGHFGRTSRWGYATRPLFNWAAHNGLIRLGMVYGLGITRQRALPTFADLSFTESFHRRPRKSPPNAPELILLPDLLNNYYFPPILQAAATILEHAGYRIIVPPLFDVGRSALSHGLLDVARSLARRMIDQLAPFAERGLPIISCEPSDVSAFHDDYAALFPADPQLPRVAQQVISFEQFTVGEIEAGRLRIRPITPARPVLLHGHCHESALFTTHASKKLLQLMGCLVQELPAGCCGMAGSFGYEREHFDLSVQMAERHLLPAVRATPPETWIVASGGSCRQQLWHVTQRRAHHSAELLQTLLA